MNNFCNEHSRVELKDGKCWACGETDGEVVKIDMSILKQFAILISVAIVVNVIWMIFNLLKT